MGFDYLLFENGFVSTNMGVRLSISTRRVGGYNLYGFMGSDYIYMFFPFFRYCSIGILFRRV